MEAYEDTRQPIGLAHHAYHGGRYLHPHCYERLSLASQARRDPFGPVPFLPEVPGSKLMRSRLRHVCPECGGLISKARKTWED